MRVVLIGGSGFIGSAILKEALGRGHTVCAIVRDANYLTLRHPRLTVISVDVMDTSVLTAKMSGHDAVISAYNPGWDNPNLYEDILVGNDSIIYAAEQSGVPRLLMVGGVNEIHPESVPAVHKVYNDYLLHNDRIDWVWFCPGAPIEPGDRSGKFRLRKEPYPPHIKGGRHVLLGDYAMAMIDELENPHYHKEAFTIEYE